MAMNPYNFVRLRPMDDDARRTPQWHSGGDPDLNSGTLVCRLTALSPIFIPDHDKVEDRTRVGGRWVNHNTYRHFFSHGDGVPTIPGSSLKGAIRAVAEAAANGCLSILAGSYEPRANSNKRGKPRYKKPFDIMPAIERLGLQPCDHVERVDGKPNTGLCPTCRLFGMPSAADGSSEAGQRPDFFAGKVSIGDARLLVEDDAVEGQYDSEYRLTELSTPDPTSYLYYRNYDHDPDHYGTVGKPRGRKFYYHQADLYLNNSDNGLDRRSTVRPLKSGSVFEFNVEYQNLIDDEFNLLLYALELDAPHPAAGARHKIGYGKPAALGSAEIVIREWRALDLESYYLRNVSGPVLQDNMEIRKRKVSFVKAQWNHGNLHDLRAILWWPNDQPIAYPSWGNFNVDPDEGGYQLPFPQHP